MIKLLAGLITNNSLHTVLTGYLTIIASIYVFHSGNNFTLTKERHDKLIFPLFIALEPVLYKAEHDSELSSALNIIKENMHLADGKLLELYYYCLNHPNNSNFMDLCRYVDRAYDKSCCRLHIKKRSLFYRIQRKQYESKFQLGVMSFLILAFYITALFIGFLTVILYAAFVYYLFEQMLYVEAIISIAVVTIPMYFYTTTE